MNFSLFLDKEDLLKYDLLARLASPVSKSVTTDDILNEIEISSYKLEQIVNEINSDLQMVDLDKQTYIDFSDKSIIHGVNIKTSILQKLGLQYTKNSVYFTALEFLFFFDNQMTKATYREQNYLSKTTFYKAETKVKLILREEDFDKQIFVSTDREFIVRLQLFQLYYKIYNGLENPFPEIDEVIDHLIEHFVNDLGVTLKPTQISKISIFLRICLLRINNGNQIKSSLLNSEFHYPEIDKLNQLTLKDLKTTLPLPEIDYIYAFLLAEGVIPGAIEKLSDKITPIAKRLTTEFIQILDASNIFTNKNREFISLTRQSILQLNIQFFTFYSEPTTFISINQAKFFEQTYPLFDIIITKFIDQLDKNKELNLSHNDKANLYFSYIFALITTIPLDCLIDQVFICVDFSQGSLYSNYIKQTLQSFNNAHIVIQSKINEKTDIYLADFHSNLVAIEQIIWQNPPSPNDWALLGDEIIQIKKKKLAALKISK